MDCVSVCVDIEDSRYTEMETALAKALYDNTAECPDELAFRKGDIVTVMDQNVAGSSGWWKCSLHGRQGLAPANRLCLLSLSQAEGLYVALCAEKACPANPQSKQCSQNIYQIPNVPRLSASPAYECMHRIYNVPSTPLPASRSPGPPPHKHTTELPEGSPSKALSAGSSPKGEVYDVPSQGRRASLFRVPKPRPLIRKISLMPTSELQRKYETLEGMKCSSTSQSNVYAVPPSLSQDPSYDIPVPSTTEAQQKVACGYNTLPNPRKSEWIYDVPMSPEKPGGALGYYGTMPAKAMSVGEQLYDMLPCPVKSCSSGLYDIPKPSASLQPCTDNSRPLKVVPRSCIYDIPPGPKQLEASVNAAPPQEQRVSHCLSDSHRGHIPLECRGDSGPTYDHPRGRLPHGRMGLVAGHLHDRSGKAAPPLLEEEERGGASRLSAADSQRSSTASTSSTASSSSSSSCDSLALSSSSPEPLREVTLSQEEAGRRLVELQEAVCGAVPRLMVFVSSSWRSREHLGQHLGQIRTAAEEVAGLLAHFLNFALDVRGNARRLTDANLQARLHKQLSIVEDSGLILVQAVDALGWVGWPLDALAQDPGQAQMPDQLERFVMVARTVPEDVRHLVSILNANGKLLFRPTQREAEVPRSISQSGVKKSPAKNEPEADSGGDDNDYVQLQTKKEFEQQQRLVQNESNGSPLKQQTPSPHAFQEEQRPPPSVPQDSHKTSLSEHCRLYFGALKKAIDVFVRSLVDGQPPERFIDHSKLVIMVGQRLVDTLCREAHSGEASNDLLCNCNHLCALLRQLAVATKKAALHFPDQLALQEAQDFAKELATWAQHFRISLDL